MKCTNCGSELQANAAVCTFCGTEVPTSITEDAPIKNDNPNLEYIKSNDESKKDNTDCSASSSQECAFSCSNSSSNAELSKQDKKQHNKKYSINFKAAKTILVVKTVLLALVALFMAFVMILTSVVYISTLGLLSSVGDSNTEIPIEQEPIEPPSEPNEEEIVFSTILVLAAFALTLVSAAICSVYPIIILTQFVLCLIFTIKTPKKLKNATCKADIQKHAVFCLIFASFIAGTLLLTAPEEAFE